jgi:hypothetical protein
MLLFFFFRTFLMELQRKSLEHFTYRPTPYYSVFARNTTFAIFFLKLQFELEFFRLQNLMQYTK